MKHLIVNADDFGLTRGVTDGIIEAHQRGIVTSTSIIAQGEAFRYAVERAREHPALQTGVHLTLVEERPVCGRKDVPTLIQADGRLPATYGALLRGIVCGRIRLADVETELRAQVAACGAAGLTITHLDSHQHVHAWPAILRLVLSIARDFGIPDIRLPRDSPTLGNLLDSRQFVSKSLLYALTCYSARAVDAGRAFRADRTLGLFESGHLTELRLLRMLDRIGEGTTELVCHPGRQDSRCREAYAHWGYAWNLELEALTSVAVRDKVRKSTIHLTGTTRAPARVARHPDW